MIDELIARGDIQKMALDSQRHVKVLGECVKSVWRAYEQDLTPDHNTGAFGFVSGGRIERQYWLRSHEVADAPIVIIGPFNADASDDELQVHFLTEIAKRKEELEGVT
jgi:hypothetical protein